MLLWEAHTLYHEHSVKQQKEAEEEEAKAAADAAAAGPNSKMPARPPKPSTSSLSSSPHILQGCVHLGTKILMERKVRKCFQELQAWCKDVLPSSPLTVETMPLSIMESTTQWALALGEWQANISLEGGPLISVDWWSPDDPPESCRKVFFESMGPFGLFLERQVRLVTTQLKQQQQQQQSKAVENGNATENGLSPAPPAAAQAELTLTIE